MQIKLNTLLVTSLFVFSMVSQGLPEEQLEGAPEQNANEQCEIALRGAPAKDLGAFSDYEVKSCRTQVVAGINYRIVVGPKNGSSDQSIQECELLIYWSFDDTYHVIEDSSNPNDCFVLLNNGAGGEKDTETA